ncbi:MAG: PadR family transcriptional regulator [Gulosibacter sp.]|uniref:PadR family transcriptional regulator n=1 Tax=Gulosibacter sp. TaxID=2817531 RepID=UPI003F90B70B
MNPPVFGHGELRLVLLTLIEREPRHGYDLINALNEHFDGDYSPSAGTIYPRLAKLQEEGLVTKTQAGRKTIYTITDAGRAEVEQRREEFERVTAESTDTVRTLAQSARAGLAQARQGLRAELDQIAAQARAAAEEALHRERAAADAEEAAKHAEAAQEKAQAKADAAEEATQGEGAAAGSATASDSAADGSAGADANAGAATDDTADDAAAPSTDQAQLLRRVDVALQQFRMEVRQDAREVNQLGGLDDDTVSELETQLRETRRRLGALLRVHR